MSPYRSHRTVFGRRCRLARLLLAAAVLLPATAAGQNDPKCPKNPLPSDTNDTRQEVALGELGPRLSPGLGNEDGRTVQVVFSGQWIRHLFRPRGGPPIAPLGVRPDLLPSGVSLIYPAFDGDAFVAVIPPHAVAGEVPASDILADIAPLLPALGFDRGTDSLGMPRDPATRLPSADLAQLARGICPEFHSPFADAETAELRQSDEASFDLCTAMLGGPVSARAEDAVQAAYGTSFARWREELEQPVYEYVFPQLVDGVPIESAGVFASRREGESLSLMHGNLLQRYVVANRPKLERVQAGEALRDLLMLEGKGTPESAEASQFELVLLPDGAGRAGDGSESPVLRYAYRGLVRIEEKGAATGLSWMVWIDADQPAILSLLPQQELAGRPALPHVEAAGIRWRLDPTTGTQRTGFQVSPRGPLTLELGNEEGGIFHRLDLGGDGDPTNDLTLGGTLDFSTVQGGPERAFCDSQGNAAFRQVHAYSHLHSLWSLAVGAGSLPDFPEKPVTTFVDYADSAALQSGSAALYDGLGLGRSVLTYDAGSGFLSPQCPGAADVRMNGAQDATTLAHEVAHLVVKRLSHRRPLDWCGGTTCPLPGAAGSYFFHDFADAFAAAYASTPCLAGWTGKNVGGIDASLHCKSHDEGSGLPRLIDAVVDHFPEHRAHNRGGYADGQIAAAALWNVRQGLRSRSPAGGTAEFWIRLNRALWRFGFLQPSCSRCEAKPGAVDCSSVCDRDIYRYLQTLLRHMVADQVSVAPGRGWAHATNKVLAGWARAGIFLVPSACLVGGVAPSGALCPSGARGGDAVIDVDDREPGAPPSFEVWTGPRFAFNTQGKASLPPNPPCNPLFVVEVSNNEDFLHDKRPEGKDKVFDNRQADGSPARATACQGRWTMSEAAWKALQGATGESRLYYRTKTYDAAAKNERLSTRPGGGSLGEMPPPFVVVNEGGRP